MHGDKGVEAARGATSGLGADKTKGKHPNQGSKEGVVNRAIFFLHGSNNN